MWEEGIHLTVGVERTNEGTAEGHVMNTGHLASLPGN